jgi:exonuclease III
MDKEPHLSSGDDSMPEVDPPGVKSTQSDHNKRKAEDDPVVADGQPDQPNGDSKLKKKRRRRKKSMTELSIITLNVNGIRDYKKRSILFDFLKRGKYNVIFLQETHITSVDECVLWNRESGFKGYWSVGTTSSCGVGILLRDSARFKHCTFCCDGEGRITTLDCCFNNQDFRFISIYVPTDGSQRIEYFQNLDRHLVTRRRLIIGGDFNCMLDLGKDKRGGNESFGGTGAPHLNNLIARFSLVDIWRKQHRTDQQFTWKNTLGMIKCRLDKFYISSSLAKDYDIESTIYRTLSIFGS